MLYYRHSESSRRRPAKQRSLSTTDTYKRDKNREESDKYYDVRHREAPGRTKSDADSEASDSDETIPYEDKRKSVHSDNDLIQKRSKRFQERRYLENWDNRSVKSVAF